jgi:MoxR-like ATPase
MALLAGRFNVSKEDLRKAAKPAIRHRIGLNFEAEADGITPDRLVDEVISFVEAGDRDPIGV